MPFARMFLWDWKEQPDLEAIAEAVGEASGYQVIMRRYETGQDTYAWIIADHVVSPEEAARLWRS
jgi:hypothetical protein